MDGKERRMRVRIVQWHPHPWPQLWSKYLARLWLSRQGADVSKCDDALDRWEVEWPTPAQQEPRDVE